MIRLKFWNKHDLRYLGSLLVGFLIGAGLSAFVIPLLKDLPLYMPAIAGTTTFLIGLFHRVGMRKG